MRRNVVEWAVLVASVAAILVLVGVLLIAALGESQLADPRVELHTSEARAGALGWIVPATVTNGGGEAAEDVVLEASATVGGQTEISEIAVEFLPAQTAVEIAFAFSARPEGALSVRLVGFRLP